MFNTTKKKQREMVEYINNQSYKSDKQKLWHVFSCVCVFLFWLLMFIFWWTLRVHSQTETPTLYFQLRATQSPPDPFQVSAGSLSPPLPHLQLFNWNQKDW